MKALALTESVHDGSFAELAAAQAAARGAHVIASVRPEDEAFVTELGASETVDYTGDVAEAIRERHPDGVDGLIDLVNRDPAGFASLVGLVRAGGHATSPVGAAGEATEIGGVAVANVGGNPPPLPALGELVKEGRLRAPIRRTYRLDEAATALQDLTNQHTLGKLLITIG